MSTVYLAMNEKSGRQWAVKEVRKGTDFCGNDEKNKDLARLEKMKESLIREKDILCRLHHKYLPQIADVIDDNECIIIIMDFIEGKSLLYELEEHGIPSQEKVIKWAVELCEVLSYLHSRNPPVIHRDIKPSNIMLKPDGDITIIDFGTAREYKEVNRKDTIPYATCAYAAPEQLNLGKTDTRTDIYSFGATLYHLLTGKYPDIMKYSPVRLLNPYVSEGLDEIIRKCMQYNPEKRYQSADEIKYALNNYKKYAPVYRKKQIKKMALFLGFLIFTFIFAGISVFAYFSAISKRNSDYNRIIACAKTTEDYYRAVLTDSSRAEAYGEMISYMLKDNLLTSDESDRLYDMQLGIGWTDNNGHYKTRYVMEELKEKNPKRFAKICNDIGNAFVYYYESDNLKDRYANAEVWFKNAKKYYKSAEIYCAISDCLQLISLFDEGKQQRISAMYEQYERLWKTMELLECEVRKYDDIDSKFCAWQEIVYMTDRCLPELLTIAKSGDIREFLTNISGEIDKLRNDITNDNCDNNIHDINEIIKKLDSSQSAGGVTG